MRKNAKSSKNAAQGFSSLIDTHAKALEDNSQAFITCLEILSKRNLSGADLKEIKSIKNELRAIDRKLDKLGEVEEDTDEFRF